MEREILSKKTLTPSSVHHPKATQMPVFLLKISIINTDTTQDVTEKLFIGMY